jgi:hypothetical protein
MVLLLLRAAIFLGSSAIGLLVAAWIVPGVSVSVSGFIVTAVVFVFGWTFESAGPEYGGYVNAFKDGQPVAGLMGNDPQFRSPDGWTAYFHTADINATIAKATAAGGVSCVEPMEVKDRAGWAC